MCSKMESIKNTLVFLSEVSFASVHIDIHVQYMWYEDTYFLDFEFLSRLVPRYVRRMLFAGRRDLFLSFLKRIWRVGFSYKTLPIHKPSEIFVNFFSRIHISSSSSFSFLFVILYEILQDIAKFYIYFAISSIVKFFNKSDHEIQAFDVRTL